MGLFGKKPKIPGLDTGALTGIVDKFTGQQKGMVNDLSTRLSPQINQFGVESRALSADRETKTNQNAAEFARQLQGLNPLEDQLRGQLVSQEQQRQFQQVPELQRAIKSSLAGSGLLRSGNAINTLSRPVAQAAQNISNLSGDLSSQAAQRQIGRAQQGINTQFDTRQQAMLQRIGADEDTLKTLFETGREDDIRQVSQLLGISQQELGSRLGIEQARQTDIQARAAAKAASKGGLVRSLAGLGGTAAGFALGGGPLGAAIGGQLGGTLGGLATGQETQFDPTLLFALQQNRNFIPSNPTEARFNRQNAMRSFRR